MFSFFRDRRRRKLLAEPFPPHWDAILRRNVAHAGRLSAAELGRLKDTARVLVAEKGWEGCGGLFVTEEMKVTIAAQAALLLVGWDRHDYFARVPAVIVYPDSFQTPNREDGWEDDHLSDEVRDGETGHRTPVIVSWNNVLAEGRDPAGGRNLVVHEFAHQVDLLDGDIDGVPPLVDPKVAGEWREVMPAARRRHLRNLQEYGPDEAFFSEAAAGDDGEFFADASEAFFTVPHDLRAEEPDVYRLLAAAYRVEPVRWFPESA